VTLKSDIAGTDSNVRSSTRSSLRRSAPTTARVRGAGARRPAHSHPADELLARRRALLALVSQRAHR
jgi:hypothetical protein